MDQYISMRDTIALLRSTKYMVRKMVFDRLLSTVQVAGLSCFYRDDVEKLAVRFGIPVGPRPEPFVDQHRPKPNLYYGMPGTSNVETIKENIQEHI